MDCFVLGSGGMMPMPGRHLSSVAVRVQGSLYLFDCGEGTQIPYKMMHLGQRGLRVILITHLHADHCLGLPGMLMLHAQMPEPEPITVIGPPGLKRFVGHLRADLPMYINFPVNVLEWSTGNEPIIYSDELCTIRCAALEHRCFCIGYRLEEHQRAGRFSEEAAVALGVPCGPLWGALQRGETVALSDGRAVASNQVLGPPRPGRAVGFVTDSRPVPAMLELLRDVDIAFVEGMFLEIHAAEALEKKHMTVAEAAALAMQAGVKRLVVTHLSPRYEDALRAQVAKEASAHHDSAVAARERMTLAIPYAS